MDCDGAGMHDNNYVISPPFVAHDRARLIQPAKQALHVRLADTVGPQYLREHRADARNNTPDALSFAHLGMRCSWTNRRLFALQSERN